MEGIQIFGTHQWQLANIESIFAILNSETLINTWIAMAILLGLGALGRYLILYKKDTVAGFITKKIVVNFMDLIEQSIGKFSFNYFAFITSIFLFIIACNWIALIPELEEPTKDLNTTLALAIVTFIYIQIASIKKNGIGSYIHHYFSRFAPMVFLNIIGELATIMSLSFRLFGNIFGGSIIVTMYNKAVSGSIIGHVITSIFGIPFIITAFFIIFEGFLQAFVFSIISLTNLALLVQEEPK